jgi:hypothetical protein
MALVPRYGAVHVRGCNLLTVVARRARTRIYARRACNERTVRVAAFSSALSLFFSWGVSEKGKTSQSRAQRQYLGEGLFLGSILWTNYVRRCLVF